MSTDPLAARSPPGLGIAALTGRVSARAAALAFGACCVASLVVRIVLSQKLEAPYILTDELTYASAAEALATRGDVPSTSYGLVYPALISPGWLSQSNLTAYAVAKAINAFLMTGAAVPVFLWARRLVRPAYALLAGMLTLALPAYVYTGTLMTENAFFPAFLLAAYAIAIALERPSRWSQLGALAAIVLAIAVRQQGVVLVAILVAAVVLHAGLGCGRGRAGVRVLLARLAPYRLLLGGIGLAVVAYVAYVSLRGTGLSGGLGAYSATTSADYSAREAARWVLFHLGDLAFATAFLPAMAFLLVTFTCLRQRGTVGPRARIFVAVALPAVLLLSVQVGLFASSFSLRVEERNLFHVMPLLLLGLVVWLDAGLPRPLRATAVAAAIPPALVLALPFGELLNSGLVNDTFGLVPLLRVAGRVAGGVNDAVILVGLGGILAVVVFAGARRAIAAVLAPALVLAFLVASSRDVFAQVRAAQFGYRYAPSVGADANWIDRAVGPSADVAYLATPNPDPGQATLILWQTDFFNRSVRRAYLFAAPAFQLDPATGRVVTAPDLPPVTERFVVASKDIGLAGRMLVDRHPVALYEVTQPLAAAHTVEGVFPDGWTGPAAAYNQYVAPPEGVGTMLVLPGLAGWSGPEIPVTVTVRIGPLTLAPTGAPALATETDSAQVTLTTGERRALVLTAPPPPFRVELSVDRTRRPADYGSGDTRELGVQVVFRAAS